MEGIVDAVEENPNRESIIKVWKDYTIVDAIVVTEETVEKPKNNKSLLEKAVSRYCGFMKEPIKEITREMWIWRKKVGGGEAFQDMNLGEIQELIDTTLEELIEDNLVEMNASKTSARQ